jgi:citronellol/citronellal dehydrogenase
MILSKPSREFSGNFCIDDTLLWENGKREFDHYRIDPSEDLAPDFFVPEDSVPPVSLKALVSKQAG